MTFETKLHRVAADLYGKPCWNVKPGVGSFITFEFGEPHLEVNEPTEPKPDDSTFLKRFKSRRRVRVRGDWHLLIYCCDWGVFDGDKLIGGCSTKRRIRRAANFLDGQKLTNIEFVWRGCRTIFEFDLGGYLETKPYGRKDEQWMLFEPSGNVLTLRADKKYSYTSDQNPSLREEWKAIQRG